MIDYNPREVEERAQKRWEKLDPYRVDATAAQRPRYILDMFPYPSGEGLHVGHVEGYTATDIVSRYLRMKGYDVLHPMGWDAFGLPAENAAIKEKKHPRLLVERNVARFRDQLRRLGFSYDWSKELNTTDPEYYTWTQWIFLKLFHMGLAYEAEVPINWCPSCKTGLANEEVEGGVCERCGTAVEQKPLRQWMLRITKYADRLLEDLDSLDWPEGIKELQRNWVGKSEGAYLPFRLRGISDQPDDTHTIKVFTTRPDTVFGATFVAVSAEVAKQWLDIGWQASDEVRQYIIDVLEERKKRDRKTNDDEKTGIMTEIRAVNPANEEAIPVWVVNYVLGNVGTGVVMGVPAHDERDFAFSKKYHLPIRHVIEPKFIAREGDSAIDPDKEYVKRSVVCAVIRNPRDGTYLCISWKRFPMNGLVTGGVEEGEDPVKAALREIREETGYKHVRFVKDPGISIHSLFYHRQKEQNRWAHFKYLFFELENEERDPVSKNESSLLDIVWKTKDELKDFFSVVEGMFIVDLLDDSHFVYTGEGILAQSGEFTGMESGEAKKRITERVGGTWGSAYKLRDWVFSRQRYWGEPIPIIHCKVCGVVPVPEKDLPVVLPDIDQYEPTGTGESPLAAIGEWVATPCPECGGPGKRETNTMPQWAGSCWYFLRFLNPKDSEKAWSWEDIERWLPVDLYIGGAEHAVLHLLYTRFWVKVLYDGGYLPIEEPFLKLRNQGMILGPDGQKMSKSKGNVINPDSIVEKYGADTLRLYEMFLGPLEADKPWDPQSISGVHRFLRRVWSLEGHIQEQGIDKDSSELHRLIKKVGDDIENVKFNTAIASMMEFVNMCEDKGVTEEAYKTFLLLLSPFAPHITEELWHRRGQNEGQSITFHSWPSYEESRIILDHVVLPIQVNGKVRGEISVSVTATEDDIRTAALKHENVAKHVDGKDIRRFIVIPGRLVSIVI